MIDDECTRHRQAELGKDLDLERFRDLEPIDRRAVDDRSASTLDVTKPVESMERGLTMGPEIGRRAVAVDDQRIVARQVGRIVLVRRSIQGNPGNPAPIELGKKRLEPVRVLIVHRNGKCPRWKRHKTCLDY